ncbi:hypothetical protein [Microbulbifer yueqingensis]|uniref:Uncharacterized protein n=1 Tax=Microbulbifer yueqingensis TaxID=658219 RepID=A0A1G8VMH0_9GAMM|nr:hypothetical protein [Microbulbifer yueqingensis]SDJ67134.1 hypothetical protein SAMN05216212_0636 [Microbulbifer yueqingensis]
MSEETIPQKAAAPAAAKVVVFWLLFFVNISVLALFWFPRSGGNLNYTLVQVFFGALVIPGLFVLVSQVSRKARSYEARMDTFTLVTVFVCMLFGIGLFTSAT